MKKYFFLILPLVLSACSLGSAYERPAMDVPASFSADIPGDSAVARDWWTGFGSRELDTLMTQALADNNDVRAALQRVEQARAAVRIAGASLLPSASATTGVTQSRNNPASGSTDNSTRIGLGASASYEIDLFGRNRAGVTAARAGLDASRFDKAATDLVVMGAVADAYFNVLGARERLSVSDRNLANAREILRIVTARLEAGAASGLEEAQQKSAVASAEASRASIAQNVTTAENALAVLLGKPPQTIVVEKKDFAGLTVPKAAPGQPSRLLENRPDILSAEAGLVAANANITVARAAFFPSVTLGLNADLAIATLGDPASTALSLAASLAQPLFQGGRLEGGVEQATARQAELAEIYRKTVLTSFQEVEDALAATRAAELREVSFDTAHQSAQRAYDLTRQRYDRGAIDFQTLIDVQNSLLQAEDSYSQARRERLAAAVDLFLAAGGGWQVESADEAPAATRISKPL